MPQKLTKSAQRYRVLVGLNYPPDKRAEVGEIVSNLPTDAISWLLKDGCIEAIEITEEAKT